MTKNLPRTRNDGAVCPPNACSAASGRPRQMPRTRSMASSLIPAMLPRARLVPPAAHGHLALLRWLARWSGGDVGVGEAPVAQVGGELALEGERFGVVALEQ